MEGLSSLPQKQLNDRIAFLQKRASTHAARTPEEIQAIKDAWAEKQQRDKTTRLIADNVLKVAQDWQEVDFSTLQKLIADNNLTKMREEARKVAQAVKAMRDEEKALSDLIPDVHGWHKQFTLSELQTVHANVARTIKTKGWRFNIDNASDLATLRRGLEREVRWMETNGRKYKTWEVSRSAYQEKLKWAEKRIEMLDQKTAIESEMEILRKSRSKIGKQLVADFDLLFKSEATDLATLKAKAADIKAKAHQLEKTKAKKKGSESVSVPFAGMTDEEAKKAFADFAKKHGIYFDPDDLVADKGFIHLQDDQHREIYKALKMETEAEHDQLWNHTGGGGRHGGRGGYVQTGNSFEINKAFRQNSILGKLDSSVEDELRLAGMTPDDLKTIRLLDKKISECSLPFPMIATRYVQTPALEHIFGEKFAASLGNGERDESKINWMNAINKLAEKKIKVDPAFLSASTNEDQNVFTHYPVKLQIELPPNTPMYITNNYVESEIVLERGTRLEFISVEVKKGRDRWSDEYITIRCRIKR